MEEKLKSILKRISWSSLLKAVLFGGVWWLLPWWLFLLVALYLYYVPIAGAGKVSAPFWVLMLFTLLEAPNVFMAAIAAAVFYFILLIKDLLIIDRRTAYEILVFVLAYLMMRDFFLHFGGQGFGGWSLIIGMVFAVLLAALFSSFVKGFLPVPDMGIDGRERVLLRRAVGWISFIVIWQFLIAGLFLPLDFLYQSAAVFLLVAGYMTLVAEYSFGELSRMRAAAVSMVIFAFLTIILASATWML